MNVAYNDDCMAVMARYPDKYFDLKKMIKQKVAEMEACKAIVIYVD